MICMICGQQYPEVEGEFLCKECIDNDTSYSESLIKEVISGISKTLWKSINIKMDNDTEKEEILSRPEAKREAKDIRNKLLSSIFKKDNR